MVVSNHFSNYTPLHCASDGAPAGFGRMLRWAEGWLGQEAGAVLTGKMLDGGLHPHFWTVRGRGEGEDSWSRVLAVTQGLLSTECPLRAPHCANGNNNYVH